jgi:hypothetical protein
LGECAACHAPGAAGKTRDTEQSLDFSTVATTAATLKGNATGLVGNFSGCNGVPFIVPGHPAQSLLVASLDQSTRKAFSAAGGACDESAISDMTVKLAPAPAGFVEALKAWITEGAPSN